MKKTMLKTVEWLGDLGRKAHITASAKCAAYAESRTPRERRIMLVSAAATFTGLCVTTAAYADGKGLASMVEEAAQQGDSIKTNAGKMFAAGGFVGAAYGGYNWWRKGKEGEHSQIKGSQILVPILAGAVLGAIGYVMIKVGETVGIQSSSQGQLPQ